MVNTVLLPLASAWSSSSVPLSPLELDASSLLMELFAMDRSSSRSRISGPLDLMPARQDSRAENSPFSRPLAKIRFITRATLDYGVRSPPVLQLNGNHSHRATLEYGVSSPPVLQLDGNHSHRATLEYGVSSPLVIQLDGNHSHRATLEFGVSSLIELANSLQ
jgi:hypothetical protein